MMILKIYYKYQRFGLIGLVMIGFYFMKYFIVKNIFKNNYLKRRIHNYKMGLNLSDLGISRQLVINGTREEQLRWILNHEILPGMVICDIGSNIGYYPIMEAMLIGDEGFIYAIEPSPDNYKQLIENIRLNKLGERFETYNIGVSNQKGSEKFFLSSYSNLHTFIRKGFKQDYDTKGVNGDFIKVNVTDLSSFLENKKKVDLIRMDVEGYEVEILEGLMNAIKSELFRGGIIFETHFPKYDDVKHSIRKPLELLFQFNYRVKIITSNDEKKSKIQTFGYKPHVIICTGGNVFQGVYYNIRHEHAIQLICELGGVRDVFLEKKIS